MTYTESVEMEMKWNRRSFLIGGALSSLGLRRRTQAADRSGACATWNIRRNRFTYRTTADEVAGGDLLTGKTAIITGCNAGLGREVMRVLVKHGAQVFGLARTLEKANDACAAVSSMGGAGRAVPFVCEQTDFSSVVACSDAVGANGTPIDMLICNAGVYFIPTLELAEGLEKHFVINHLSHFILVNRLLPLVMAARQGRIVVVGSDFYRSAPAAGIEFDNLSGQRYYDAEKMYGQSKLANGLFVLELARRLQPTRATANVVHPGWVMTDTMHDFLVTRRPDVLKSAGLAKTTEQGAATIYYAATSPFLEHVSGAYLEDCNIVTPGGRMCDAAMATKLWAVSERLSQRYLAHA